MYKRITILALAIGAGIAGIWQYQGYETRHPSTEDAYVDANVVRVAPRITGRIASLDVVDQQQVHKDELLFSVDPAPFRFAVQRAQADLALAKRQVEQAEAAVASARAEVHHREVLLGNASEKLQRAQRLAQQKFVSDESVTDAEAEFQAAEANLQVARARQEEARRQLGRPDAENDRIMQAQSALDQAQWELDNTQVFAACSGQVGELKLQPGNVVSADHDAFVLVCNDRYWVEANYKETQLENIRSGQPVDIRIDMYPDHDFHGVVESIDAAAGSAFSLLPPQNATGNWVKVTQRVPVRIRLESPDPGFPLRVGTSTTVTIDTTRATPAGKQVAIRID
jgi:membrane fusion protein (multidrug efflux system)